MTKGEKGVIAAEADIGAWMEFGAALTDEDFPAAHRLAAKALHAQAAAC